MASLLAAEADGHRHGVHAQRHTAYASLRKALVLRRIPAGERLREPAWSQRLGVNRAALREALARLNAEGLVTEGEKGGYFVPLRSPDDLHEIVCARVMIESAAGELAIQSRLNGPEHLGDLQTACDELEWMIRHGYAAETLEADQLFHDRLVAVSGSRRLMMLHRSLPQPALPYELLGVDQATAPDLMLAEHRSILAALRRGQSQEFKELLQLHYRRYSLHP